MKCSDVRARMAEHEGLDPKSAQGVSAHLAQCPSCAAAQAEQRFAVARLRDLPLREPPPGLEARLLALPTTAAAPSSLAPVLSERLVMFLLAAATVLTAWGLWRASVASPGDLRPGAFPPVADGRGRAGAEHGADASLGDPTLSGDSAAFGIAPTVVARLHPPDLRIAPGVAAQRNAVAMADNRTSELRPRSTPPGRGARAGVGAGTDASPPDPGGGGGAPVPPAPSDRNEPASRTKPDHDRTKPEVTIAPTVAPVGTPTAVAACTQVTMRVRIIADVAGGTDAPCIGCDGRFDDHDKALLSAAMPALPVMSVGYFSATQPEDVSDEITIFSPDTRYTEYGDITVSFDERCVADDQWPIVMQLNLHGDAANGWSACPTIGAEVLLTGPDATSVTFAIRQACPLAEPPLSTSTATAAAAEQPAVGAGGTGGPAPPATETSP